MGKELFHRISVAAIAAVVGLIAPLSVGTSVFALSDDQIEFFSQNHIMFYDPNGGRRSCYSGNLSGDTVMAKVVSYLQGNNPSGFVLSDNGIAGILANFQHESGFNPFKFQSNSANGPGYGIAQFTSSKKPAKVEDSPILPALRTDARTSNYFNEYFDIKYSASDAETGYPKETVPEDVLDAWLAVQLDYFLGPSSEFENTRIRSYRHYGGEMGLDYISDSMTVHEALDAAKSPEDAARIFVWIMERPGDKPGQASVRSSEAQKLLSYVQNVGTTTTGDLSSVKSGNGDNVTIIGDSITVGSEAAIKELLPNADIHAQVSKQFYNGTSDNPGGYEILKELADSGELRDVVIYALGTNGGVTLSQAEDVMKTVGDERKVIFVTNYTLENDYDANNNVYAKIKNQYTDRVKIADWKTAVQSTPAEYLSSDGIHPNEAGRKLFAEILSSTIGASVSGVSVCVEGSVDGGLTDEQIQVLADYYNGSEVDPLDWNLWALDKCSNRKLNCVSFVAFFVQRFTSIGKISRTWGDGKNTASYLARDFGLPSGTAARPFAVFSVTQGSTTCKGGICGHTGIVLRVEGDTVKTLEAAYCANGAEVDEHDISWFVNTIHGDTFTYLDDVIDPNEILQVVGGA